MDQDGCSQLGKLSQLPKNSMLNELIISEAKYDLVIRITEDAGGWISLHKMLLALKAPKLLEALENDGNKGMDEEEIEWVKWPSKISLISFKKFLAWVYNGTPGSETTEEDVSALLQIAKDYEIFELAEWCEQMSVPMTTSTIMPLMHQGLVSGNDELVTKILYALASDQEEILPLNPFVKLGLRHQAEERAANAIHTANIFDALFRGSNTKTDSKNIVPLHRFLCKTGTNSMYNNHTTSVEHYTYIGVCCKLFHQKTSPRPPRTVALHRFYIQPDHDNVYTTVPSVYEGMTTAKYEGSVGYVYPNPETGTVPVFEYYSAVDKNHFYTKDWNECKTRDRHYNYVGIAFYAFP